jgi:hypothetical protein
MSVGEVDGGTRLDADSSSELKSPISLVHEIALKRNLPVVFEVVSENGPPHMRTFVTRCLVGEKFETVGEGNGKKVSFKQLFYCYKSIVRDFISLGAKKCIGSVVCDAFV